MARVFGTAAAAMLVHGAAHAAWPEIEFSAARVERQGIVLEDVRGHLGAAGDWALELGRIETGGHGRDFHNVSIEGAIREMESREGSFRLLSDLRYGRFGAEVEVNERSGRIEARLTFGRQALDFLRELESLPAEARWLGQGHADAEALLSRAPGESPEVSVRLAFGDVGFDSPDGRFAGAGLELETRFVFSADDWGAPEVSGSVRGGELLVDDFYRDFGEGAMDFSARPLWRDGRLDVRTLRLSDGEALVFEGRARPGEGTRGGGWELEVNRLKLQFPGAYERYLEPVLAPYTLNGLTVTGRLEWAGRWAGGAFRSGDLRLSDLSIVDSRRNRFAFTGLAAHMRPGDHGFDSRLSWRGLLLGRINLGRGEVALDSEPGRLAIVQPLTFDLLGGRLRLQELMILLPGFAENTSDEPDIRLRADIEELDMEELTGALGWPAFSGTVSGRIPGVSLEDGVLDVEGKIEVSVFDGRVAIDDLRVERPFGVLPSLAANLEMTQLDLEQLTGTFSFGQISGRVDGYVRDLRMLDWRPVAFDAWLGTPDSQRGSENISRQAVNRLTTLGGGRVTTALTSPVLRLFNNFSYKRLGLGCRMSNNVCEIRGVSEDEESVLIMEGAGVPKVTIRAFNRRVDWPQLLAHLTAAGEGGNVRVGD